MRRPLFAILALVLVLGMAPQMATPAAALPYAEYHSHGGGNFYPTGGTVAEAVATPYDGKFVQLGVESWVVLKFPDGYVAAPDGTPAPDLLIDIYDAIYDAYAEIYVSLDGSTWTSLGVHVDTANIDLDLEGTGPVKYVMVDQADNYIDPAYPDLGFDLDGVDALNSAPDTPEVVINIKPYSWPNAMNTCSQGGTPVIIWGSEDFDVYRIDLDSLRLGENTVRVVGKKEKESCIFGDFGQPTEDENCVYIDGCDGIDDTPDSNEDLKCKFVTLELGTIVEGEQTFAELCFDYDADGDDTYETPICVSQEVFLSKDCSTAEQ
jgi:hypothetical protein